MADAEVPTIPAYVKNMDDAHLSALRAGERLDTANSAPWSLRVYIIPLEGDAFLSDAFADQRSIIETLAPMSAQQIFSRVQLGFIKGGSAVATPEGFVYGDEADIPEPERTAKMKFDSKYGLRFPQLIE